MCKDIKIIFILHKKNKIPPLYFTFILYINYVLLKYKKTTISYNKCKCHYKFMKP